MSFYQLKLSKVEDARGSVEQEHEKFVRMIRTGAKTSEGYIIGKRDGVLYRYHGAFRLVPGITIAADERNAGHTDTLAQVWLLAEERHEVNAAVSSARLSEENSNCGAEEFTEGINNSSCRHHPVLPLRIPCYVRRLAG